MEGPCAHALRTEPVVAVPNIRHEQRWPRYVAGAVSSTGLEAQLAVQLFLDEDGTLGELNMYSTRRHDLDPEAEDVAQLFAAHALERANEITGLTQALVGQAMGILMEATR